MIRIAICDESAAERARLEALLTRCCAARSLALSCAHFSAGAALCDACGEERYDALLLRAEADGLDTARRLRRAGYDGVLVLTADTAELAPAGFEVGAAGYLLRPVSPEALARTLGRVLGALHAQAYPVRQRARVLPVPCDEIIYIESSNSRCLLHRADGAVYPVYKKLDEIERELRAPCFLRCHRSYLVNMNHVARFDRGFVMTNGESVLVRQKSLRQMRLAYENYRALLDS